GPGLEASKCEDPVRADFRTRPRGLTIPIAGKIR
ncbi:MAG: hypothetical protein ACI841_002797, partial [Planctomycetota bacterium]